MTLKIPVISSPTALPGWVRQAADAVNGMGNKFAGLVARIVTLEAFQTTATGDIASLEGRATTLEVFAAAPFTVASITLPPAALPGSPVHGMVASDIADGKLKYYDGAIWQSLY